MVGMFAMTISTTTPGTSKVRRDVVGGKRGAGNKLDRRIRRPDARKIDLGRTRATLTGHAGLAPFGAFLRELGVDAELESKLGHLKSGTRVVYPMGAQLRLLLDAQVAGETRVLGIESLAADPMFVRLCGGTVPSIDTIYRDLDRFGDAEIATLEQIVFDHGVQGHALERHAEVHLDLDSTVEPLFGAHEGGAVGYNPRAHGRPSYHPIVTRIAETGTCVGAQLRRGDTTFGSADVDYVRRVIGRVRDRLGKKQVLFVRMDAAADCAPILRAIEDEKALYVVKARVTDDLAFWTTVAPQWRTVDRDADGNAITQVAEVQFRRDSWAKAGVAPRVIAVRTTEDRAGRQLMLWEGADWATRIYLTNSDEPAEDVAARYEGRAGIEPLIAEWKHGWGIDQAPCWGFDANHAALLIKMLAHNLLRRFVRVRAPELLRWRVEWIRRAIVRVAGQLVRSGRSWSVRVMPTSRLVSNGRRRE